MVTAVTVWCSGGIVRMTHVTLVLSQVSTKVDNCLSVYYLGIQLATQANSAWPFLCV